MPSKTERDRISRVLIIEGDEAQRLNLTSVLKREGFGVITSSTAAEALEHVRRADFGAAVVDMHLPDLEDAQLLGRIREHNAATRVILHAAHGFSDSARDSVHKGAFAYIEKAGDPEVLVQAVHRAFREQMDRYVDDLESTVARRTEVLKQEIEERKQAEERLRLAEFSVDRTAMPTLWIGPDARVLRVNDAACRSLGYSRDELTSMSVHDFDPVFTPQVWPDHWEELKQRRYMTFESRHRAKDGRIFPVEITVNYLKFGDQEYSFAFVRDITDRKQAEEALRASEGFSSSLLSNAPNPVVVINPDTSVRYVNPALERLTGFSSTEVVGRKIPYPWWPEETLKKTEQDLRKAFQKGAHRLEELFQRKNGERFWVSITSTPVMRDGEMSYYLANWVDITDRKQAEERLRLLSSAVEQSREGIAVTNMDGDLLFINNAFAAMHGYTPAELVGKHLSIFHTAEQMLTVEVANRRMRETGEFEGQIGHVRRDGGTFLGLMHNSLFRDETGKPIGMISTVHDVTEQKQAEEALRESEERFRQVAESSAEWIWEVDAEGRYTYSSSVVKDMLGYEPDELIGRHYWELFEPEEWESLAAQGREVFAKKHAFRRALNTQVHKAGDVLIVETTGVPILDDEGKLLGYRGVNVDVTDRKRAEQELRKERDFSASLLQASPTFFVAISKEGRTLMINEAMLTSLGYAEDEVVGSDYLETFIPEPNRESLGKVFDELVRSNEPTLNENRVRAKDGRELLVEWHGMPVFKENGESDFFFGVGIDITGRKQAEEEKRKLEAQLRQAQKMEAIGTLAAGVAHDFNNSLTAILGYTDVARLGLPKDSEAHRALEGIDRVAQQAGGVTRSLLTLSRKGVVRKAPVRLGKLITDSVQMLRGMLPAAIELVTDVPPADDLWVQGDATQLQQVAVNLAINARDAMPNGGRLRMCVHHQAADPSDVSSAVGTRGRGVAALVVEDTGTGMPEEVRARIFEPFFTTKPRELGTGLGMAIVHGIVTDHGGRIEVDSHEGQGTRITITLPCCDPPGADETAAPDHLVESGHGETVIVAEDNPQILTIVASALRAVGYEVVRASDGDEAVALFNAHRDRTCLVILDLDLPKKSGVACLREMRNLRSDLPAIFITGNVDPDSEEQPDGRTRLLRKPFRVGELTRHVAEMVSANRRQTTRS